MLHRDCKGPCDETLHIRRGVSKVIAGHIGGSIVVKRLNAIHCQGPCDEAQDAKEDFMLSNSRPKPCQRDSESPG